MNSSCLQKEGKRMWSFNQIESFVGNAMEKATPALEKMAERYEKQYKENKYKLKKLLSDKTDEQIRRAYQNYDNLNQLQKECIEEEMEKRGLL